ncbi:MAG: cation:proton antiporter [Sphingobacteriaceae bacterium]|nr:cation:proton antiporter [Sphingobacteriaceae bacterium]
MLHLPDLIIDLTLILCSAAVVSLIFKKLKQPVVLGYIIAGLLVGSNFKLFPTVADPESIRTWADIGVIFLLFSLGLEFSFKKLIKVGGVALVTALIEVSCTMTLGYFVGLWLNWSTMDCLFLGGILAIASTTIIIRAFDELNVKTQKFTNIVMGVLIVEDLVAVVLMVVLSTVAVSRTFEGTEMFLSVAKLSFFLVLWFVSGIFFLPSLLKRIQKLATEEMLLIIALALCFAMVYLATAAGFSPALGAFIMGSILAETTKAEKIEHLIKPVRNLFAAIFFVSVGMLIDPKMLSQHAIPIIVATLILLIGKPLFVTIGTLITGQPLKIAVQSGMSLSQIGEFSFIIATLGLSLKVTSDFLYPVAVAVSVVTTFTTPFMIRFSEPAYKIINRLVPVKWKERMDAYSTGASEVKDDTDWKILLRFYLVNVLVFSVVIVTVILLSTNYLAPLLADYGFGKIIIAVISLITLSPFLWALAFRRAKSKAYANVWLNRFERGPLILLMLSRVLLSIFFIGFLLDRLFSTSVALIGAGIAFVIMIAIRKQLKNFYGKIELRFLNNLNIRENEKTKRNALAPWDTHISTIELNAKSPYIGKTLVEAKMREEFGVNIAAIERGDMVINLPERHERLYPFDVLSVIGTDEQLSKFKEHLENRSGDGQYLKPKKEVTLQSFIIENGSSLIGKSIRQSGIRERTKGLVVGVERANNRILNPESDFVFNINDRVWIVGDEKRIRVFSNRPF